MLRYKKNANNLKFEIEEFVYNIFYSILQLQKLKREKYYICLLSLDFFLTPFEDIYELIVKTILDYPIIHSVKLAPKTLLPVYTTGYSSGIVVDVGYVFTYITPINNGFPYLDKSENIAIGSSELERCLKRFIYEDNVTKEGKTKIKNIEQFNNNIISHLNDLLVRSALCVNNKLSESLKDTNEEAKIKSEFSKIDYYNDLPDFQVLLVICYK